MVNVQRIALSLIIVVLFCSLVFAQQTLSQRVEPQSPQFEVITLEDSDLGVKELPVEGSTFSVTGFFVFGSFEYNGLLALLALIEVIGFAFVIMKSKRR